MGILRDVVQRIAVIIIATNIGEIAVEYRQVVRGDDNKFH